MRECQGEPNCTGMGPRRACGHYACDDCTDEATDFCLCCCPVDDVDYNELVERREAFLSRAANEPDWDLIAGDRAAEEHFAELQQEAERD